MSQGVPIGVVGILLVALIALPFAACADGIGKGIRMERERAIGAGVARWVIDPRTGERTFKYSAEGKE